MTGFPGNFFSSRVWCIKVRPKQKSFVKPFSLKSPPSPSARNHPILRKDSTSFSSSSFFFSTFSYSFSFSSAFSYSFSFSSTFSYSFSPTSATPAGAFTNAAGSTDDLLRPPPPPTSATDELRLSLPRPAWRNAVQCSAARFRSLHKRYRPVEIVQIDRFPRVHLGTEWDGFETDIYFGFSF